MDRPSDWCSKASRPMGIGSIGSIGSISFWQQDQNYWTQAQAESQATAANDSLINLIGSLQVDKVKGLASIANKVALNRVNAELTAALQSAVAASKAAAAAQTPTSVTGKAATGTGTVPLTADTSLLTLGIPANSAFSVSDGTNST